MRKLGAIWLFFLVFLCGPVLWAQDRDFILPPEKEREEIFDKPVIIKTVVSREIEENKTKWVEMYMDLHTSTSVSFTRLRSTLLEFEKYPLFFKRNVSTEFHRGENLLDMVAGLELMGFSFYTWYRVLVSQAVNEPGRMVLNFTHVDDDGRVRNVKSRWYLERYYLDTGEERCYVRYFASSAVIQKYPLQRTIMSMFINSESRDLLSQFLTAASGKP
jgi:hypothetical protein